MADINGKNQFHKGSIRALVDLMSSRCDLFNSDEIKTVEDRCLNIENLKKTYDHYFWKWMHANGKKFYPKVSELEIKLGKELFYFYMMLAEMHFKKKLYEAAYYYYFIIFSDDKNNNLILDLEPENIEIIVLLGKKFLFDIKDYEKAVYLFSKVISVEKNHKFVIFWLGMAHESLGNREKADSLYEKFYDLR